jgi:hypothetical protein
MTAVLEMGRNEWHPLPRPLATRSAAWASDKEAATADDTLRIGLCTR